jgi:hypothetical protein
MAVKKDKPTMKTIIKEWLQPTMLLGAILYGAWFTSGYITKQEEKEKANKEVQFDDSRQKHDVVDLLDIEYHPFTVAKSTDTLKAQLKRVDTLLEATYNQKQRDARERHIQDSIDNTNEIIRQKSRDERTRIQEEILDRLEIIDLRQKDFKKQLDKLNDTL